MEWIQCTFTKPVINNNYNEYPQLPLPDTPSFLEHVPNSMYQPIMRYYWQKHSISHKSNENNSPKKPIHVKFNNKSNKSTKKKIKKKNKKKNSKYAKHSKHSNDKHYVSKSMSTEWTESTYNNTDCDQYINTLTNDGFVISAQYLYDDDGL